MMWTKISELQTVIKSHKTKKRIVLAVAHDEHALCAVHRANKSEIVSPIFVGDKSEIKRIARKFNLDLSNTEIIDETNKEKAIEKSIKIVSSGNADILMKGNVHTAQLLKGVLNKDWGLRTGKLLSHFALFEVNSYHKLLGMADVAMNIAPNLKDKISIIKNSVECLNNIGINNPKVAILSAVEIVDQNMQATLDAALIAKMGERGQISNCIIDGPLAFDNIVSRESARYKGIESKVAGNTDFLLLPNIETGNVLYKALVFFAKAKLAGIILGAKVPIVLTSRSDSEDSKYNSILLAAATSK